MDSNTKLVSLLKGVLNATPDIIFAKDTSFAYLSCNKAFAKLIGKPIEQIVGAKDEELFDDPSIVEWFRDADRKILATEEIVRIEEWVTYPDGKKVLLDTLKSPFYDESGKLIGLLGVCRDITERVEAENLLKAAKDKAEKATAAKSDFLAKMSHEIRTPMNGILGTADLMAHEKLDSTMAEYTDIITRSAQALLYIINDVLDFSKIEAGKMELECIEFEVEQLVSDVCDIFVFNPQYQQIELIVSIDPELPHQIKGDPFRIRQILVNFLSNAYKFTQEGHIVLCLKKQQDDHPMIYFSVTDSGIGMSKEGKSKLFKEYSQTDSSITRTHGGTGLGLSICKKLAHLMQGTIGVDSRLGHGSTFWFSIPLHYDSSTESPLSTELLIGKNVLIIDDNPTFCTMLMAQLRTWHMSSEIALNGSVALNILEQHAIEQRQFDIVILDLRMPGMDGWQIAATIQARKHLQKPPIILLSALNIIKETDYLNSLGISAVLRKPATSSQLFHALSYALGFGDTLQKKEIKRSQIPVSTVKNILLAEDNVVNQTVLTKMLEKLGHRYRLVNNGRLAVDAVCQEDSDFEIILMDCEMPEMDGIAATKAIRQKEKEKNQPELRIIALTGHTDKVKIEQCLNAGMNAMLSKPITLSSLQKALSE